MPSLVKVSYPVIFFANGIGDHVLGLPAIRALVSMFPKQLSLICPPRIYDALYFDLPFWRTVEIQISYLGANMQQHFDADAVARQIQDCDLFLCLNTWHTESVGELLERLIPNYSIGFFDYFTDPVPLDYQKHSADLIFDIPKKINSALVLDAFAVPPPLSALARKLANDLKAMAGERKFLVIHADSKADKIWPADRFAAVLNTFLKRHEEFLILIVGWDTLGLEKGTYHDRIIPCCDWPLSLSAAAVSVGDLFCGIDSSMLHLADFFRVPGVGLFGPTSPQEFGFRLAPHIHVFSGNSMMSIREDEVLAALEALYTKVRHTKKLK